MLKLMMFVGLVAYVLKLTGLCFSAPGHLSDKTLIEAAFDHEMTNERGHRPAFDDVGAYLRDHPTCCTVNRGGGSFVDGHLLNALFGRRFFEVSVKYPVAPDAGYEFPFYQAIYIMDCCGISIPDVYGIGSDLSVELGRPLRAPPRQLSGTR